APYSLLFLHSPAAHPDLHSFPTRRSSDLPRPPSRSITPRSIGSSRSWRPATSRPPTSTTSRTARWAPSGPASRPPTCSCRRATRSEEHTSELQSRENLVCRLLLEKKKNNQ